MNIDEFRDVMRKLATELEDLWIEKELYRDVINRSGISTPDALEQAVAQVLSDPLIRKETHERFAGMWEALNETAMAAWLEDPSTLPPGSGKPN